MAKFPVSFFNIVALFLYLPATSRELIKKSKLNILVHINLSNICKNKKFSVQKIKHKVV